MRAARNILDKLDRYFWFDVDELRAFFVSSFILGVVVSWSSWGADRFDLFAGLKWLSISFVLCSVVLFVHHAFQRVVALLLGFRARHFLLWTGLSAGLISAILSRGAVWFLAASATRIEPLRAHRIGKKPFGISQSVLLKVALSGVLGTLAFAIFVRALRGFLPFADLFFSISVWFALCNLLPIPELDGAHIFYFSRALYALILLIVSLYGLFSLVFDFYPLVFAILLGFAIWLWFLLRGG
ncbi:hypothetical protein D6825_02595 [Candidatus Woesearchaeota archaeon]|nr:MAG: hypothetical protein D6825_02595 [Candidatus Woesearchaeota archaeon]